MKSFMLVAMLIALLVTAWLVVKSLEDTSSGKQGSAPVKAIERADQARQKVDSTNREQERKLGDLVKD